jgi:hypothetical protein
MECISLENDGDKGIVLNQILKKVSVILKIRWKILSSLETRGCVAGENLWECIKQKLWIVAMLADCQAGCCCYNKSNIFQGS